MTVAHSPDRTPGQRAGLTHAAVLTAARELLDDEGLPALTMRALADRLSVAPNSLYSHVANKTALIDDVLDDVLDEVATPSVGTADPVQGLQQLMTSTYSVLLAHRDLVPLYLDRQGARGPNAQRLGAVMEELLARVGVIEAAAREALRVLIVYTIGFAAFATRPPIQSAADVGVVAEQLQQNFDAGLRWLLAGIVAQADATS